MTKRKIFLNGLLLFFLAAGGSSCATLQSRDADGAGDKKAAAVIRHSFASQQIQPGGTWKIYLDAFHPDGHMKYIVCVIDQPGMAAYPASFTRIREENRKELSGYIYLNTITPDDLNFVTISLTIQIQDQLGNYSRPAVFPLSFLANARQEPPPPGVFKNKDLGPVMVTLRAPGEGENRDIFKRIPFRR